jgi:hypothetical protein
MSSRIQYARPLLQERENDRQFASESNAEEIFGQRTWITPSLPRSGGKGRGEEARYIAGKPLSPVLSPIVPRGARVTKTSESASSRRRLQCYVS